MIDSYSQLSFNILTSPKGLGLDIGISFKLHNIFFGAVIKDIGTYIKWDTEQRDFKQTNFSVGIGYPCPPFLISADVGYEYDPFFKIGMEYLLVKTLFLRTGFNQHLWRGHHLTAGMGIYLGSLSFDYAFSPHNLGDMHTISASFTF